MFPDNLIDLGVLVTSVPTHRMTDGMITTQSVIKRIGFCLSIWLFHNDYDKIILWNLQINLN